MERESVWYWGVPELPQLGHRITMRRPRPTTCNSQCPWLNSNHGRSVTLFYDHEAPGIPMPDEPFSFDPARRAEVWAGGLADGVPGYGSLCHVRLAGTHQRRDGAWEIVAHECTGAVVMQQRELLRLIDGADSALSRRGAARIASNMLGMTVSVDDVANLRLDDLLTVAHPAILDETIGCESVAAALTDAERERWRRDQPLQGI